MASLADLAGDNLRKYYRFATVRVFGHLNVRARLAVDDRPSTLPRKSKALTASALNKINRPKRLKHNNLPYFVFFYGCYGQLDI